MYKGKAFRIFPYSNYILFEGDCLGGYYGLNVVLYKLFGVHKSTKCFKNYNELKEYFIAKGYEVND